MYLKQTRYKDGRVWLSIVRNYWQEGVSRTRTVEKVGWLSDLKDRYPDPVAHFKAYAKELTAREQEATAARTITIHPLKRIDARRRNRKNLGFAAASAIYHRLRLHEFLDNRQRHRGFGYSADAACRLLVYDRILHPSSKKGAWEGREGYFDRFDLSRDDCYRALTHMRSLKDALMAHLNAQVSALYGRDAELVYYDVTNYYFDTDSTDRLRKKGVSKEHRPSPVVQMGLLLDAGGLPVAYDLFPGNTLDCETLIPILSRIKGKGGAGAYGFPRIIAVADKGINTSDNIAALLAKGDGYVFSRSARKATGEMQAWVTDRRGYGALDGPGTDGAFMIKSRIAIREIAVTVQEADKAKGTRRKTRRMEVTERQVAFWSEKYDRRAKAERAEAVAKARQMVARPSKLKSMLEHTAARYVVGLKVDDNGEVIERPDVLVFDEAKLDAEEELDGYYVLTTSEVGKSDREVLDIYRGLWRIEETFRVAKSDLSARPVYVWTEEHIEAHFLICFIALLIIRILQKETGWKYSAARIAETLSEASGTLEGDNWWLFNHRDDVIDDIGAALGIDFTRERLTAGQIRSLVGKTKKVS